MAIEFPSLPDFDRPPVTEVVMSLQFEGAALQIQHVGALWDRYRDRFPSIEVKPPLDPIVEDLRRAPSRAIRIELADMPSFPRLWFVATSGTELIQVQADRFIHNWRKTADVNEYPRYERIRKQFAAEVKQFTEFVQDNELGQVRAVQCEITYINHIGLAAHGLTHADAARVFRTISADAPPFLGRAESQQFATRYIVAHPRSGEPFARLYVDMTPAFNATNREPVFVLNFTARGSPLATDLDGALDFYDAARRYIVCGFVALTTPEMHTAWGIHE